MSTPDTTLDTRFSDPAATAAGWDETRQALEDAQLSWICTVRADSRPHLTPLVAVWLDGALYFSTGAGEQKAVNLRGNPHVLLLTGCHRWDDGLDVVAEGDAVQVTDEALLTRLAAEWARKWDGQWQYQVRDGAFWHPGGGTAQVFEVRPAKVLRSPRAASARPGTASPSTLTPGRTQWTRCCRELGPNGRRPAASPSTCSPCRDAPARPCSSCTATCHPRCSGSR